ncbi:MAG: LptF/LptG family permease [Candidatus Zipacnadales bacterium]
MKLLDRLITSEVLAPLLIGTLTFVVLIVGHLLFEVIRPVVERGVPLWVVIRFVLYQVPNAVALALPVSMLLAAALAVHRLARDNELLALRATGLPTARLLGPVWVSGLAISAVGFLVAEYAQPFADRRAEGILGGVLMSQPTLALQPAKFASVTPDIWVLPTQVDDVRGELVDLRVFYVEPKGTVTFLQSRRAHFEGDKFVLERPLLVRLDPRGGLTQQPPLAGTQAIIHLPKAIEAYGGERRTLRNMTLTELQEQITQQQTRDPSLVRPLLLELHCRLSLAFASLAFSLVGGALALVFRSGRSLGGVLVAILFAFIYYVGMLWARMAGETGVLPVVVAAWLPNGVTVLVACGLLITRD